MKSTIYFSRIALLLLLVLPCLASAQLQAENLLQALPSGYKIGFHKTRGNMIMQEMVPKDETVENWTEMVTTQVFQDVKSVDPDQFQVSMKRQWVNACKDSMVTASVAGEENGYPTAFWVMRCPFNSATGRPEVTYFKTIKGNDGFYVIQKAFKFEPQKKQTEFWVQYLRSITVCDTRLTNRACPDLRKQGFERTSQ